MDSFLFYESPYDAINKSIATSGKTRKAIASTLYPGREITTAMSLFTRALTPENTDVNLSIEKIIVIMKETRPDDFIYFLCDEFGFDRPQRKTKKDLRQEMEKQIGEISNTLTALLKRLPQIQDDYDE